jgi:hypothetical protein
VLVVGARTVAEVVRPPPAWAATAALAALWLAIGPGTPDLAAQVHRSQVFGVRPFAIWDGSWFAGHHLPAYSLMHLSDDLLDRHPVPTGHRRPLFVEP